MPMVEMYKSVAKYIFFFSVTEYPIKTPNPLAVIGDFRKQQWADRS